MNHITDEFAIEIFNYSFTKISPETIEVDNEDLKKKFLSILGNENLPPTERLVGCIHLLPCSLQDYCREGFFEICFEKNILNREELSALYLSLHTQARPYRYFSKEKLHHIFHSINLPMLDFESKNRYNSLSDTLTIYRGIRGYKIDIKNIGYCWSLNKDIASNMFGTGDGRVAGFVVTGEILKQNILGYILTRDEEEIIIKPEFVEIIEIESITTNEN